MYQRYIKRSLDIILSLLGILLLSWLILFLIIVIKIDDPGPAFFTQKRFGKNKDFFNIHKFRSMKMSTPRDIPTHMLVEPEIYLTRVGKFIRKFSLDELPQLFDILIGNMSVVGPRPALWNQEDLVAERDKYHANDVLPGLTGLAQVSGRDELEIEEKAAMDGEYVRTISFSTDLKCIFKTFTSVIKHEGVVEGGTGEINRKKAMVGKDGENV